MSDEDIDLLDAARQLQREMNDEGQVVGALFVGHLVARVERLEAENKRLNRQTCPYCPAVPMSEGDFCVHHKGVAVWAMRHAINGTPE